MYTIRLFVPTSGIVHVPVSKSMCSHFASRASFSRDAVRMVNNKHTGEGLDETDPDRPRIDGIEAVFGTTPDRFVRVGNDTMAGAGVGRGDLVAITQSREPEHGDLVAAQIDDVVEVRRFVRSDQGDMLEAEPEKWVGRKGKRVEAHADNVRMLGVEIACMVTAQHRKQREQERIRERKGRGRER